MIRNRFRTFKTVLMMTALLLLSACNGKVDLVDSITDPVGTETSVTVGFEKVSAVSVVLKGKANLGPMVPFGLYLGFEYKKNDEPLPSTLVPATTHDDNYNFSAILSGLEPGVVYSFRSVVTKDGKDTYGETISFTTKELASMFCTLDASDVSAYSVTLNGNLVLTDVQYEDIDYGFYWGTSESELNAYVKGGAITENAYSAVLTNLSSVTPYWYKAYLKLDEQIFYGVIKTITTDVVHVTGITLDKTTLTLNEGQTATISVTSVTPDNANDKSVTWSSSNMAVATVDQSGQVTTISKGRTAIMVTAKDGSGVSASCDVYVSPVGTVDMGFSSEGGKIIYWATSNLSESGLCARPEDYGDYYAWGETQPYYAEGHGRDNPCSSWRSRTNPAITGYNWASYKWCNGSENTLTKYNTNSDYGSTVDNKRVLDADDDVAHVKLGGSWRMPTNTECWELINNCTWQGTTLNGVRGYLMTSKVNGASIFLPAAGFRYDAHLDGVGSGGGYWSSSTVVPSTVRLLSIISPWSPVCDWSYRYVGYSVRPVSD